MVNISSQIPKTDLMNASAYSELAFISHYISLDNVFVLNRTCKIYHTANYLMRYKFWKLIKKYNPDIIQCTDFVDLSDSFLYKYRNKLLQIVHDPFPHSGEIPAQVRKSVDSPAGMLTEDHHHTVHEESQVCYSSHLRPKSLHL